MAGCKAYIAEPSGHDTCRSHSFCGYLLKDVVVWHPEECETCYGMCSALSDDGVSSHCQSTFAVELLYFIKC